MSKFWKGKKVLVSGSEGMIGKELVIQLKELGADVYGFDIMIDSIQNVTFKRSCQLVYEKIKPEFVFHLFGIKGNPKMTKERPVDFMGPMLQGDTNMILAAQKYGVKRFLYTSSIAVENPESDKYPAWAKQTAETLIEAMKIQYPEINYCIVRPANVYGRFDNFERKDNMVVTSLIKKAMTDGQLVLDIEGAKQTRDFINAKDVARGMIKVMEELPDKPVNLCSGESTSINYLAAVIKDNLDIEIIEKDLNLTLGPDKKVMEQNYPLDIQVSLKEGIKEAIEYLKNESTR